MTVWLLGIDNPSSGDPSDALSPLGRASAGARLFLMSGMSMGYYLEAFRRANVIDFPDLKPGDQAVVLGKRAWSYLGIPRAAFWSSFLDEEVTYHLVPHPSGKSLLYNSPLEEERLRTLLLSLAGSKP